MHIILVHGLGRSPLSLAILGRRLSRQGHSVSYFGYAAFRETFEQIVGRLVVTIRAAVREQPYALVGHSLGGILARASLPALADLPPYHLVMLASPNQSPLLARLLQEHPLYQAATRDCGRKLADPAFYRSLSPPVAPTTIFAGTAGPRGRLSPFGDQLNDGIVSVEETRLGLDANVVLVPSIHTLIMNSSQVIRTIGEVLQESGSS